MNDAALQLFRYSEKIDLLKQEMIRYWPEIPTGAVEIFGDQMLASGVVLWALFNHTGLDLARWPGEVVTVLGLQLSANSDMKIGEAISIVSEGWGLVGTQIDQLQTAFLEMLKWHMVEQLHTGLFANQRAEVAKILAGQTTAGNNNRAILQQVADYLGKSQLNTPAAKSFFEQALKISLTEMQEVFKDKIDPARFAAVQRSLA